MTQLAILTMVLVAGLLTGTAWAQTPVPPATPIMPAPGAGAPVDSSGWIMASILVLGLLVLLAACDQPGPPVGTPVPGAPTAPPPSGRGIPGRRAHVVRRQPAQPRERVSGSTISMFQPTQVGNWICGDASVAKLKARAPHSPRPLMISNRQSSPCRPRWRAITSPYAPSTRNRICSPKPSPLTNGRSN